MCPQLETWDAFLCNNAMCHSAVATQSGFFPLLCLLTALCSLFIVFILELLKISRHSNHVELLSPASRQIEYKELRLDFFVIKASAPKLTMKNVILLIKLDDYPDLNVGRIWLTLLSICL